MEQCPKCGRYLRFKLAYNCGTPTVGYDCICGYDSFKNGRNTIVTDTTNMPTYWSNASNTEEYKNG